MEEKYADLTLLGNGAYSEVWKARDRATNEIVALKKYKKLPGQMGISTTTMRETSLLQLLNHKNIVRVHSIDVDKDKNLHLVLEYLDMDLKKYMDTCPEFKTDHLHLVKSFLRQILLGLEYCHSKLVLHRDLKPQHILIDCKTKTLKLADFGLARRFGVPIRTFTSKVMTMWYRAPEIILGIRHYSTPVDVWSVGCIFAEMVNGEALFRGRSEIDTLNQILRIMGTPNANEWPGVDLETVPPEFPHYFPQDLATVVQKLEETGRDLLSKMLCLDPSRRITAKEALNHDYFKGSK